MLFQYTHLPSNSIRLVRFLPYSTAGNLFLELKHHSWDDSLHYSALSYVCGDLNDRKPITLGGRAFMIGENLWDALNAILKHHRDVGTWFWIDALCINQRDLDEKSHQVQQMSKIFSSADRVFAWLGVEDEATAEAFSTVEEAHARKASEDIGSDSGLKECECDSSHRAIKYLLGKEYFQRAWTIPEFVSAKEVTFLCGRLLAPAEPLIELMDRRRHLPGRLLPIVGQLEVTRYEPHAEYPTQRLRRWDVCNLVQLYNSVASFDNRDRAFAMLNDPRSALPASSRALCDYRLAFEEVAFRLVQCWDCMPEVRQSSPQGQAEDAQTFIWNVQQMLGLHDPTALSKMVRSAAEKVRDDHARDAQGPAMKILLGQQASGGAEESKI